MYSNRDMILTERESRTEDLAEKMEELTDRVTELPGRKKTAQEIVAKEVVLPYGILYSCSTDRMHFVQLYGSVQHMWEAVLLVVQPSRGVLGFSWGYQVIPSILLRQVWVISN